MSRRDKEKLIIIGSTVAVIAFVITIILGSSLIPWGVVAAIAAVAQCFLVVPRVASGYYELNQATIGSVRYIPIVNEIQIFSPIVAKLAIGGCILVALVFGLSCLPLSVVGAVLPMKSTIAWGYNTIVVGVMLLVILNFIFAIGLCSVLRNVNLMVLDCVGEKTSTLEVAFYVLMMLPVLRVCSLMSLLIKINMLIRFGYGTQETEEFIEED